MLIFLFIFFLLSIAVTLRRDKFRLFSQLAFQTWLSCCLIRCRLFKMEQINKIHKWLSIAAYTRVITKNICNFTSYISAKNTFIRSILTIKLFKLACANFFMRKNIITLVLCFFVALIIRLGFKQIDLIFIHNDSLFGMCTALSLCLSSLIKKIYGIAWFRCMKVTFN